VNGLDDELTPAETRANARAARRAFWIAECRAALAEARARQPRDDGDEPADARRDMSARVQETPIGDGSLPGPDDRVDDGRPDGDDDHRT
jgi:hypothetical protein